MSPVNRYLWWPKKSSEAMRATQHLPFWLCPTNEAKASPAVSFRRQRLVPRPSADEREFGGKLAVNTKKNRTVVLSWTDKGLQYAKTARCLSKLFAYRVTVSAPAHKVRRKHLLVIGCRVLVMVSSEAPVFRFIPASRYLDLRAPPDPLRRTRIRRDDVSVRSIRNVVIHEHCHGAASRSQSHIV